MPRPTRILSWLMLAMLVGGHWGMLQMVAWTGMLMEYSRDNSFSDAVEMTFSGEHPCALCKQVDQGLSDDLTSAERKAPGKVHKTMKLDAVVTTVIVSTPTATVMIVPWTRLLDLPTGIELEPPRRPPWVMG